MKELDLFRFVTDNSIEMRWDDDVLSTWIDPDDLREFAGLIESSLSEGGHDVTLLASGCVWVDLVPICDYYGVDPERIVPKP